MFSVKKIFTVIAVSLCLFSTSAFAKVSVGKTYYTKYNFKHEKGRHITTNYWRGIFVPINSLAKVVAIGGDELVLEINDQTVTILNKRKHTQRSIEKIASELLSTNKSKISGKYSDAIESGELRLGMTKKQVIQSRGYPPRHKTPSNKASLWVYWSSRFVQLSLAFRGDRLTRGRGIR